MAGRAVRGLIAGASLAVALGAAADAPSQRTVNDAVFTKDQAREGKRLYRQHCQMCHDRRYFEPVLRSWDGRTLGMLFETMSSTMPQTNPGMLPRENYVDILAYILEENDYPDGESELDYRGGELDGIVIAQP